MINQVIEGDCLTVLKTIPDKSIDLVLTSPPYEDFNGAGYGGNTKDILFLKLYSEFFDTWLKEVFRVLKDNGDRKSTRLNSSHVSESRMPSSA